MKMKLFDRILVVILCLLVFALALFCAAVAMQIITLEMLQNWTASLYSSTGNSLLMGGIALILLLILLRLAFRKKPQTPNCTLVKTTEVGSSYITLSAIDGMVQKFCKGNNRVRECITAIRTVGSGIQIDLRLALMPDTDIPALTGELQRALKEYVEALSGIHVEDVGILVESCTLSAQERVG